MSGVGLPSGEAFWGPRYGITSESALRDVIAAAAPVHVPGLSTGVTDLWATDAWTNPFSSLGIAAQAIATGQGYPQPLPPAADSMLSNVIAAAVAATEESRMPGIIVPDTFQVTISALCGGRVVDNVVGVQNAGGTAQGACDAVKFAWENAGGPLGDLPDAYEVQSYTAVDLRSATGPIAVDSSTATGGDSTHQIATRGACALLKWNGGNRSRSVRGRLYLGPLTESSVDADGVSLTSGASTGIAGNIEQFIENLGGSGYPLCVISRKLQIGTPVTTWVLEPMIATQRRRIRG